MIENFINLPLCAFTSIWSSTVEKLVRIININVDNAVITVSLVIESVILFRASNSVRNKATSSTEAKPPEEDAGMTSLTHFSLFCLSNSLILGPHTQLFLLSDKNSIISDVVLIWPTCRGRSLFSQEAHVKKQHPGKSGNELSEVPRKIIRAIRHR